MVYVHIIQLVQAVHNVQIVQIVQMSFVTPMQTARSTLRHINIYILIELEPDETAPPGGVYAYNDMYIFWLYSSSACNTSAGISPPDPPDKS